jgi:hypothetical protein
MIRENFLPPMPAELREIFRTAYLFRQKHQNHEGAPDSWRRAADDLRLELARLNDHPFARALLFCCYKDLEREEKPRNLS